MLFDEIVGIQIERLKHPHVNYIDKSIIDKDFERLERLLDLVEDINVQLEERGNTMETRIYFISLREITSKKSNKTYFIVTYLDKSTLKYNTDFISVDLFDSLVDQCFELFEEVTAVFTLNSSKRAVLSNITR